VIEFNNNGTRVATGGFGVSVHDPKNGNVLASFDNSKSVIRDLDFHSDNIHLVGAGEEQEVYLWNTEKRNLVRSFTGHTSRVQAAAYRPGWKQIVSAEENSLVRIWDIARDQGGEFFEGVKNYPSEMVFAPGGKLLAASEWIPWETGHAGGVQLWDTETKEPLMRLDGHEAGVAGIAFSHDGSQLVSASYDNRLLL